MLNRKGESGSISTFFAIIVVLAIIVGMIALVNYTISEDEPRREINKPVDSTQKVVTKQPNQTPETETTPDIVTSKTSTTESVETEQVAETPTNDVRALEQQIHYLINYVRQQSGLPSLTWDDTLWAIALNHSRDMAVRNYFNHVSPEGYDIKDRYQLGGFIVDVGWAENIFQCSQIKRTWYINGIPVRNEYYTQEEIAQLTVQSWMESPGHRKNILTPDWKREGIGIAISVSGQVYVTQNFG